MIPSVRALNVLFLIRCFYVWNRIDGQFYYCWCVFFGIFLYRTCRRGKVHLNIVVHFRACCLISYFLSNSPSWSTVIKFAEVLIWNECFAADSHKTDRLFLGSILSLISGAISFWRMNPVLISVILGSEVLSFIYLMKMNILQCTPFRHIIFANP